MDTQAIVTVGSIWALCAVMAGISASEKNRRFWVWFFFGVVTGPYGLYRAVRSDEVIPPDLAQSCPNCKKTIRKTARSCPKCGHILLRKPDTVMKAGRQAAAAFVLMRRAAQKSTAMVKGERAKREARKQAPAADSDDR